MNKELTVSSWDKAYEDGKYDQEDAVPFIRDIVKAVDDSGLHDGLGFYPGCGNGRNLVPLLDAGLTIEGNDISPQAIAQLKRRRHDADVSVGDFMSHRVQDRYAYLLSIQLFQHGDVVAVRRMFDKAHDLLREGGLLALRVNSIHTQIVQQYDVVEKSSEGGFTVRYLSGQKTGLDVHFYSAEELHSLTANRYEVVLPLREAIMPRDDGTYWAQWETIVRKR